MTTPDTQPHLHGYAPADENKPGIQYDTPQDMADYLLDYPGEIENYMDSTWRLAVGMMAWGDYRTPREILNMMLDVLLLVAEKQGKRVLK